MKNKGVYRARLCIGLCVEMDNAIDKGCVGKLALRSSAREHIEFLLSLQPSQYRHTLSFCQLQVVCL